MTVAASIPFSATPSRTFEVISLYGNWSDVVNDLLKRLSHCVRGLDRPFCKFIGLWYYPVPDLLWYRRQAT